MGFAAYFFRPSQKVRSPRTTKVCQQRGMQARNITILMISVHSRAHFAKNDAKSQPPSRSRRGPVAAPSRPRRGQMKVHTTDDSQNLGCVMSFPPGERQTQPWYRASYNKIPMFHVPPDSDWRPWKKIFSERKHLFLKENIYPSWGSGGFCSNRREMYRPPGKLMKGNTPETKKVFCPMYRPREVDDGRQR